MKVYYDNLFIDELFVRNKLDKLKASPKMIEYLNIILTLLQCPANSRDLVVIPSLSHLWWLPCSSCWTMYFPFPCPYFRTHVRVWSTRFVVQYDGAGSPEVSLGPNPPQVACTLYRVVMTEGFTLISYCEFQWVLLSWYSVLVSQYRSDPFFNGAYRNCGKTHSPRTPVRKHQNKIN